MRSRTAVTATSSKEPVASFRYRAIKGTVAPSFSKSAAAWTCWGVRFNSRAIFNKCVWSINFLSMLFLKGTIGVGKDLYEDP